MGKHTALAVVVALLAGCTPEPTREESRADFGQTVQRVQIDCLEKRLLVNQMKVAAPQADFADMQKIADDACSLADTLVRSWENEDLWDGKG